MKISSLEKIFYFWRGLVCISMVLTGLESRKRVASAPTCVLKSFIFQKKIGVVVLPFVGVYNIIMKPVIIRPG